MICLLNAKVIGCKRVPVPPAKIIPFIIKATKVVRNPYNIKSEYKFSDIIDYSREYSAYWNRENPRPEQVNGYTPAHC